MELFTKLFQSWLVFVYHCFDRIVISGYLMGLQRPGQVVYWLQQVLGIEAITKEVLGKRTEDYVRWVEAYARNRHIPMQWAERDVRKEDYVRPYLRRMQRRNQFGVYFIFQTMEQGWTLRPGARLVARHPGGPADYPILHRHRARYRYYYFYLRDEVLGAVILRVGTFIPFEASYYLNGHSYMEGQLNREGVAFRKDHNAFVAVDSAEALQKAADSLTPQLIQQRLNYWTFVLGPKFGPRDRRAAKLERSYYVHQIEYCQNFVFRKDRPIQKVFERACELGLWRVQGERIWRFFGRGHRDRIKGHLQTIMERLDHGRHVFRAYWKHAWVKQYEKCPTFLRHEITSNNLKDFKLKKGLAYLLDARQRFQQILDRFAGHQAENLNVHEEFTFLRRISLPVQQGTARIPGIRIQDLRMRRLLEVLLHAGTALGGWSTREIHRAVLDRFTLREEQYNLSSLRYDLRKLKGHGLLEREAGQYRYRLTEKGQRVAILFLLFHQRLCGPIAGSQFDHQPDADHQPQVGRLERAYYKADAAINDIVRLLRAA
jgi:hypothetical protein